MRWGRPLTMMMCFSCEKPAAIPLTKKQRKERAKKAANCMLGKEGQGEPMSNEESPTVFLLEEWRWYTNNGEWHTVPSGSTLYPVRQALSFAERRARNCPGVYRIAVYRRVGATEVTPYMLPVPQVPAYSAPQNNQIHCTTQTLGGTSYTNCC